MIQALDNAQVKIDELDRALSQKDVEIAHLKSGLTTIAAMLRKPKQRSKKNNDDEDLLDEVLPTDVQELAVAIHNAAKHAAHIHVLFWTYFTSEKYLGHKRPAMAHNDVGRRWISLKSRLDGLIAEYFESVPELFHDYLVLKKKPFWTLVSHNTLDLLVLCSFFCMPSALAICGSDTVKHGLASMRCCCAALPRARGLL